MMSRALGLFALLAGLASGAAEAPAAEANVAETRALIEQWVQTRQLTDRTRSDWASERTLLEQSKALFEKGLQDEAERLTRIGTNVVQVGREREAVEQELAAATNALARLAGIVGEFEQRVRALEPLLPDRCGPPCSRSSTASRPIRSPPPPPSRSGCRPWSASSTNSTSSTAP
jgi:hypothetical protein